MESQISHNQNIGIFNSKKEVLVSYAAAKVELTSLNTNMKEVTLNKEQAIQKLKTLESNLVSSKKMMDTFNEMKSILQSYTNDVSNNTTTQELEEKIANTIARNNLSQDEQIEYQFLFYFINNLGILYDMCTNRVKLETDSYATKQLEIMNLVKDIKRYSEEINCITEAINLKKNNLQNVIEASTKFSYFEVDVPKSEPKAMSTKVISLQVHEKLEKTAHNPKHLHDYNDSDIKNIVKIQKAWKSNVKQKREISISSPNHLRNKAIIHELMSKICHYVKRSTSADFVNQTVDLNISENPDKRIANCGLQSKFLYELIMQNPDLPQELKDNTYIVSLRDGEDHAFVIILEENSRLIQSNISQDPNDEGISSYIVDKKDLADAIIIDSWLKFVNFNAVDNSTKTSGFMGNAALYIKFINEHKDGRYINQNDHQLYLQIVEESEKLQLQQYIDEINDPTTHNFLNFDYPTEDSLNNSYTLESNPYELSSNPYELSSNYS